MARSKFSIAHKDEEMLALVSKTDQRTLALWAIDCAGRVLPHFEKKFPQDRRPRQAIETLKIWLDTGVFKMSVIRKASLDSHAAAREVGEDIAARSAARAAGQAVATAHVPRHAYGSAIYAQQAIHRYAQPSDAEAATVRERDWQFKRLLNLGEKQLPRSKSLTSPGKAQNSSISVH
ncbi:MAG: putative immunity protein [Anaerolineales bacterium]